ncbi:CPBP family intramembrane glutamic endopeptidase [Candidatus Enterococcus clewellii]|uniref:CAAX prenyl protease 2/Lysostaphin resistance protein A-like domain-containing protein n=2 Tax=Candidatus Enterococcus clewellii TaxID=1834193 RepID=A0AAQ3Y0V2_9ENTE
MDQFINQLISSIFQVIFFGLIPLFWWIVSRRSNNSSLLDFLGLKKISTENNSRFVSFCLIALVGFMFVGYFSLISVSDLSILANSKFTDISLWSTLSIILYAFVQTALSEEIFFRGFLAKRLIHTFNYRLGNFIQATLFGLTHFLMLITQNVHFWTLIFVGIMTGVIGYILCYINEKLAGGSLFPSWIVHGITNVVSTLFIIFLLN